MKIEFYAVKDELANEMLPPGLFQSKEIAIRQFKSQINTIPMWKDNPSDFSLYRLGTFDNETGEIVADFEKITGGRSLKE